MSFRAARHRKGADPIEGDEPTTKERPSQRWEDQVATSWHQHRLEEKET